MAWEFFILHKDQYLNLMFSNRLRKWQGKKNFIFDKLFGKLLFLLLAPFPFHLSFLQSLFLSLNDYWFFFCSSVHTFISFSVKGIVHKWWLMLLIFVRSRWTSNEVDLTLLSKIWGDFKLNSLQTGLMVKKSKFSTNLIFKRLLTCRWNRNNDRRRKIFLLEMKIAKGK